MKPAVPAVNGAPAQEASGESEQKGNEPMQGGGNSKLETARPDMPSNERRGSWYAQQIRRFIEQKAGQYIRDEAGQFHVLLGGRRILINADDLGFKELMISVCDATTVSPAAKAAIQRLEVLASNKASKIQFRLLSALSRDQARLYIPAEGSIGRLLQVSAQGWKSVPNGNNEDSLWVEHPLSDPFRCAKVEPKCGLGQFERLLVDTLPCRPSALKWLVAMHEGFFPFVRDACPARPIMIHLGPSQLGGKTSGAQRFSVLHGLGEVKGDYSVAALGNMRDTGLLVMDNKEHANMTQDFVDYLLFLATGAQRGRSNAEGGLRTSKTRPVAVITSIEGVNKAELQNRCINVDFLIDGPPTLGRRIELEIADRRNEIYSSMVAVFIRYFQIQGQQLIESPLPNFQEYFTVLADLLRAVAEVAEKPAGWSDHIIDEWRCAISNSEPEQESDLEFALRMAFPQLDVVEITYKGRSGSLYITEAEPLCRALRELRLPDLRFPMNSVGLGRRLRSDRFRSFTFLDKKLAPEISELTQGARRTIGFFVPHDGVTDSGGCTHE